jgi:sphingomyelin phosphodiesterase
MNFLLLLLIITPSLGDFAIISDVHYDQHYKQGSPTKCLLGNTGMGCCRSWDIALNGSLPAPEFGIFGCDAPKSLLDKIIYWLSNQTVDYLVFLGDVVDHDLPIQNPSYNLEEISTFATTLKTLPYPAFAVLGNHDGFIIDNLWDDREGYSWLEKVQEAYGSPSNLSSGGYYRYDFPNYTGIFLNCLLYDTHNIEIEIYGQKDLFNQTAWLLTEIKQAKEENRKVYLFSHFGADTGEATDFFNNMIVNLNYTDIVYFAGHSHMDEIRLANSSTGEQLIFYIHPSVVPDKHFPEMRIYKEKNGEIYDYIQYGFNLTSLQFEKVYSARESYGLADLSTYSWVDFLNRMQSNATLAEIYDANVNWGF